MEGAEGHYKAVESSIFVAWNNAPKINARGLLTPELTNLARGAHFWNPEFGLTSCFFCCTASITGAFVCVF